MPSQITAKFGTSTAITATGLASLASSTTGGGYQLAMVDNSSDKFQTIHLFVNVTTGTSPTANRGIYVYLIKFDKTSSANIVTDNAATTAGALNIVSAQQIAGAAVSGTSNQSYSFDCIIQNPGPAWTIAVVHDTAVALNSTTSNHLVYFVGENPEAQ